MKTVNKKSTLARLATLPMSVAKKSVGTACSLLIHQPKEPKSMAERFKAMDTQNNSKQNFR